VAVAQARAIGIIESHEVNLLQIRIDDLRGPEIAELVGAHLAHARRWSPAESKHALDLDALRAPEITFWTAWDGASLLGCGALKELDPKQGELKSVHTAARHRRRGVAAALLAHIVDEARARSYQRLSLETGSMDALAPARALYSRLGFVPCEPFGGHVADPNSVFMRLDLVDRQELGRVFRGQGIPGGAAKSGRALHQVPKGKVAGQALMAEHTVVVWGKLQVIALYRNSKSVWIAAGDFMGERIEVKASSASAAAKHWAKAARHQGG
jgi:putative acetyltransferase